jgi:hypothetical protein
MHTAVIAAINILVIRNSRLGRSRMVIPRETPSRLCVRDGSREESDNGRGPQEDDRGWVGTLTVYDGLHGRFGSMACSVVTTITCAWLLSSRARRGTRGATRGRTRRDARCNARGGTGSGARRGRPGTRRGGRGGRRRRLICPTGGRRARAGTHDETHGEGGRGEAMETRGDRRAHGWD